MSDETDTKPAIDLSPEMRALVIKKISWMADEGLSHMGGRGMPAALKWLQMAYGAAMIMNELGMGIEDSDLPSYFKLHAAVIKQASIDNAGYKVPFRSEIKRL